MTIFEAAEEQVKRVRVTRPIGLRARVERSLRHRVASDEEELASVLAEAALVCRREVDVVDARVGEVNRRDIARNLGQLQPEQLDRRRCTLPDRVDHARDDLADDRHHVEVVAHEAQLRVKRGVLGEVACRVVRLGTEYRTGLVHTLKDPDEHLLVQLRALCEERTPPEVVGSVSLGTGRRISIGGGSAGSART